jgi:hypothetical protein
MGVASPRAFPCRSLRRTEITLNLKLKSKFDTPGDVPDTSGRLG